MTNYEKEVKEAWNRWNAEIIPPKHGRWMPHPEEDEWDVCSVCGIGTKRREHGFDASGEWKTEYSYHYCPNCGAKMDEVEE